MDKSQKAKKQFSVENPQQLETDMYMRTSIGSLAFLNVKSHNMKIPDPDQTFLTADLAFSPVAKVECQPQLVAGDQPHNHELTHAFLEASWSNIPLPLKELVNKFIQHVIEKEKENIVKHNSSSDLIHEC